MQHPIGPLMIDLDGLTLAQDEIELLQQPIVGGVILFTRNGETPEQISQLTQSIRQVKPNLLIAVDQEGGRVQRLQSGFTRLPPVRDIGKIYDQDKTKACELAHLCGWVMAIEILAVGIDFSFAPVLDIDHGVSQVIGNRAFYSDPDIVATLAEHWIDGIREVGMHAVGKHFPGHGAVSLDSHTDLPRDLRTLNEIKQADMRPFVRLIQAGISGLMPAHIVFAEVDNLPVGFSRRWLQDILRKNMQFNGAIFSDDLTMEGASIIGDILTRSEVALAAGCDMILICNNKKGVKKVVKHLNLRKIPINIRLANMKQGVNKLTWSDLQGDKRWNKATESLKRIFI
ncbi:MAG: beta-N-acetylhexosaminidase [Gammaproteobacteria bacterium RIFCSPHIGHO2_02_FULL_42_13]|nr:MAG: beta-N-acetylhexosaminidase [Gammaproteobacteria bacterium RIFCSPHIGHO2_02_FULL_42_13]OGT68165.1 MAG: beta-N-acetylhexosaminidase [Gammaproteobacteria bacterium RIFCSPLOWO2_02_FULL_42_9]